MGSWLLQAGNGFEWPSF